MRGMVRKFRKSGGFVPLLLALLLLFRLLIPSGYMIAPDQEGKPVLALCAAPVQPAAEEAAHGGHEDHPADPGPSTPAESPCAFAALSAPPLTPEPPAVVPQAPAPAVQPERATGPDLRRVPPASPPPPPTGPPIPV